MSDVEDENLMVKVLYWRKQGMTEKEAAVMEVSDVKSWNSGIRAVMAQYNSDKTRNGALTGFRLIGFRMVH